MIEALVKVLNFEKNEFESKDGVTVKYNSSLVRFEDGSIVKMSVDKELDLTDSVDSEITVELKVSAGTNMAPKVKIIDIVN